MGDGSANAKVPGSLQQTGSGTEPSGSQHANASAQHDDSAQSEMLPQSADPSQSGGNRKARRARQFSHSAQPGTSMPQGTPEQCPQEPSPATAAQEGQTDQSAAPAQRSSGSRHSKQRYPHYLASEEVGQGLKMGALIRATIRINPQDRAQAFATVPGLPSDLMIRVRPQYRQMCMPQAECQSLL